MSKKSKIFFAAALSLLLLVGCEKEKPDSSESGSEQTSSDTSVTTAGEVSAISVTTAAETVNAEDKTTAVNREAEKAALKQLVENAASEGEDRKFEIYGEIFGDFDSDGRYELIARCKGNYWYTNGKDTRILRDSYFNISEPSKMYVDGQTLITMTDGWHTYLYTMKDGDIHELEASGIFGDITNGGNGVFTAVCHGYENSIDENREHTWKTCWLYFEDGEFKEYVGEKINKADFMKYMGGKAALDKIEADGGTVADILYRENGIVNINYTVTMNDTVYNKFYIYDVSGGDCKKIRPLFGERENDYGVYRASEIEPYSGEQLALHELIKLTSGSDPWNRVLDPLFGDFDGDGKNELIAEYGTHGGSELWFAADGRAYKLEERLYAATYTTGGRCVPCIVKSAGNTYIMVQHTYAGTLGGVRGSCDYYLIKNGTVTELGGTTEQNLIPDGDFGDLISDSMTYDLFFDKLAGHIMGQSWKNYWFYFLDGDIRQYYGREITREEFLKYDGAAAILDKIAADGKDVIEILKRGNGTVTVNIKDEDDGGIGFSYVTAKYRQGKLLVVKDDGDGTYWDKWEESAYMSYEPTDFERFSEMIYDTAEGDENSFIRERFYGNIDGKNALYAYYGTDEDFSLWYADRDGAKKVTEDVSLFYADGDVLMKKGDGCFVMKNGKSQKLDTFKAMGD